MNKPFIVSPFLVENCDLVEPIKSAFEEHGYEVRFTKDLQRYFEEEGLPDVLLLEPSLFHWEWLTVLLQFRKNHPHIPVILFSTHATADTGFCNIADESHVFLSNDIKILRRNLKKIRDLKVVPTKTILLVDDDEKILNSYIRMLRKKPWKIIKSTSGERALSIIEKEKIDLVVTDIKMPEMHGMDLISRIRLKSKNIPIIVSSGFTGMSEDLDLKYHHVAAFLSKPVDDEILLSTLSKALGVAT